ncbi:MAG: CoA transferase [Chloroflexi bacterium]|nr:CoA transferase [Chloroflexota bacterium]
MSNGGQSADGALALRGIRVLDFTWIHAGPSATRILADQGAEVIKVESDQALAVVGGPASRTARGLGQRHNWNAGKLSISLNMKTPEGVAIAQSLVAVSDVVAENFSGRVMPGWGMEYESIRRIKPDIIMLSMSGFGRTGPWKDRVSYGQTLQAVSGFTELTGFPDTDPCGPASAYSDAVGGMAGAQAVLLALIHRARTGQGQWIDLSQFEALSSLLETLVLDLSANNSTVKDRRTGNRLPHGGGAPHGAYRCRGEDRWVAIAVFTDDEWKAFATAIGRPPWTDDERFATATSRLSHADALDSLVDSWTVQHTAEAVMHLLQTAGVAAGVIQTGADLAEDPQLKVRGFFRRVPDAQGVLRTVEGPPYKLSRTPGGVRRGAPEFGFDQTYVLREVLGMPDDELAECAIAGVFD